MKLFQTNYNYDSIFVWIEIEKAPTKLINYATDTPNSRIVERKHDDAFRNLICATKVNLATAFVLENIDNGIFRYSYVHTNNMLFSRSKFVCNRDDMAQLKEVLNRTDVFGMCIREIESI